MFNSKDIYSHLMRGGDKQVLFDALRQEIAKAEEKIKTEKEAEQKAKKLAEQKAKARAAAFKALKDYLTLVNPNIEDDVINSVLSTLEFAQTAVNTIEDIKVWCV